MSSRAEALSRLKEFIPRIPEYAYTRNYVRAGYENVSQLSRWIRYRVISEEECVSHVLENHDRAAAEKFLQEVLWRTYWKGWLELRPAVWEEYVSDVVSLSATHENDDLYRRAILGDTRLSFFNDWVSELVTTGYLHNHTRMWFASAWIFTLRLPWQLGARFMYHHLLDGDAASNTLSWRWVAGLHTPGKIYVARPDNVAKYSEERWTPTQSELCEHPAPPTYTPLPPLNELPPVRGERPSAGSLLMLTDDDLSADLSTDFSGLDLRYCIFAPTLPEASPRKKDLVTSLRTDAAQRTKGELFSSAAELSIIAQKIGADRVHSMTPHVGWERHQVNRLSADLRDTGISTVYHRRMWDQRLMPLAQGGFFKFWERAKSLL